MVMPLPCAARISTKKTDNPAVGFAPLASGLVRARRTIKSECSARLVQIF